MVRKAFLIFHAIIFAVVLTLVYGQHIVILYCLPLTFSIMLGLIQGIVVSLTMIYTNRKDVILFYHLPIVLLLAYELACSSNIVKGLYSILSSCVYACASLMLICIVRLFSAWK